MRRQDREVKDPERIEQIISACSCMRLGFCDQGQVYIVPLSFGYVLEDGGYTFYYHGAKEGRKAELIKGVPSVGFEMDANVRVKQGKIPCGCSVAYQSIIGNGVVSVVEDPEERIQGLQAIMKHQTGSGSCVFSEEALKATLVFKLTVEQLSCKEHE